jgi:hypothetical protein
VIEGFVQETAVLSAAVILGARPLSEAAVSVIGALRRPSARSQSPAAQASAASPVPLPVPAEVLPAGTGAPSDPPQETVPSPGDGWVRAQPRIAGQFGRKNGTGNKITDAANGSRL